MTVKAVLLTGQASETDSTQARNLLSVGGISLFARQLKILKSVGINEVHVVTDWYVSEFEAAAAACTEAPASIFIHPTRDAPQYLHDAQGAHDQFLLLEEGVLIDPRIINALLAAQNHDGTCLAFLPRNRLPDHITAFATPLNMHGEQGFFGSAALIPASRSETLLAHCTNATDLRDLLQHLANDPDSRALDISSLPLYVDAQHGDVPLVWMPLTRIQDSQKATRLLLTQTDVTPRNWPEQLIYLPLENLLALKLCVLPSTPQMTFSLRIVFSLFVLALLAMGQGGLLLIGLVTAILVSLGIGIGPKLAALKMQPHQPPLWQVWIARIIEYGWYLAIGISLSVSENTILTFIITLLIVLFQAADDQQRLMFRVLSKRPLRRVSRTDQRLHFLLAERDSLLWTLLPFAIIEEWHYGLLTAAAYMVISFFIRQARLKRALQAQKDMPAS